MIGQDKILKDPYLKDNFEKPANDQIRSNRWCIVINNPSEEEYDIIRTLDVHRPQMIRYVVYQTEVGESGTLHIQGYIQLQQQQRMSWLKKIFPRANLGKQRKHATNEQARHYCLKPVHGCTCNHCETQRGYKDVRKVDEPFEWGVFSGQAGERSDLLRIKDAMTNNVDMSTIVEDNFETYVRYHKGIHVARFYLDKKKRNIRREVETTCIVGPSGIGKITDIFEEHGYDKVYCIDCVNLKSVPWFDGYEGEKILLLDEFYGGIPYNILLRMLDRHPFRCPIKGGFTYANWTHVYITSNDQPETWYEQGLTPALQRRMQIKDLYDDQPEEFLSQRDEQLKIIAAAQKRLQQLQDCEDI